MAYSKMQVQQRELDYARSPLKIQKNAYNKDLVFKTEYIALNGSAEIADGISVVPTPGHSPGSQSVIVNTAKGPYIIVGDLICLYGTRPNDHKRTAYKSFRILRQYEKGC